MKKLIASVVVALIGVSGCTQESKPGGPGAAPRTDRGYQTPDQTTPPTDASKSGDPATAPRTDRGQPMPPVDKVADPSSTFTLKVTGEADLKRGERKEVVIAIDRGRDFKEEVTLKFTAPRGLKVTPNEVMVPAGEKEAKVTIESEAGVPAGEMNIEVTGMPPTGSPTTLRVPVEVHAD
jgi:hypothetical protein